MLITLFDLGRQWRRSSNSMSYCPRFRAHRAAHQFDAFAPICSIRGRARSASAMPAIRRTRQSSVSTRACRARRAHPAADGDRRRHDRSALHRGRAGHGVDAGGAAGAEGKSIGALNILAASATTTSRDGDLAAVRRARRRRTRQRPALRAAAADAETFEMLAEIAAKWPPAGSERAARTHRAADAARVDYRTFGIRS